MPCFKQPLEVFMKELKEKVKELRVKKRWAQEDLAREMGVSLSTIQRWESRGGNPTRLARRELKRLFQEAGIMISE
jgi:transcriptional regulator with XRE-family HTH domain